ncbi:hypothetical protein [Nocardia arthritidis]|uniref:DUF3592 domain-containing protein n=1 Tax=Nocardia arthritidis TaxID=228602 RepID=A0A6G9YIC8_9NOCA|nr:hypothetical protein [Nocardia arthritidis]QIS13055.1 hypothetical protein F5544_26005 [Nocardia arthritidis]
MDVFLYIVPCLMIAGVVLIAAWVVNSAARRTAQLRHAWDSGLIAQGRCLRMFTTTSGGGDFSVSTTRHYVYEFTARDGRVFRFEETGGPATRVEGDVVAVYYAEGAEAAATTWERGHASGATWTVVLAAAVVVVLCAGFILLVNTHHPTPVPSRDTIVCTDHTCRLGPNPLPEFGVK